MDKMTIIYIVVAFVIGVGLTLISSIPIFLDKLKKAKVVEEPDIEEKFITSKNIKYSQDVMSFIKEFTIQVSVLRYREFFDNHRMDKVTKAQIQTLVSETAMEVNRSLRLKMIDYNITLYTKEFVEHFIVQTTMVALKDLLEKSIIEIVE